MKSHYHSSQHLWNYDYIQIYCKILKIRDKRGEIFTSCNWRNCAEVQDQALRTFNKVYISLEIQRSEGSFKKREIFEIDPNSNEYYLQKSASIQPRTSPSKFGGNFKSIFIRLLGHLRSDRTSSMSWWGYQFRGSLRAWSREGADQTGGSLTFR